MKKHAVRHLILATSLAISAAVALPHAQQGTLSAVEKQRRIDTECELQSIAVVERKVMMPMPDGVRLATDIYRPKNAAAKVPIDLGADALQLQLLGRPQRRAGRHDCGCSPRSSAATPTSCRTSGGISSPRGNYDILGSKTDGYNTVDWLTKQPWSNGKIGTTGCSSTAEYQMGVAALGPSRATRR
jgi:predicted acyl esterase